MTPTPAPTRSEPEQRRGGLVFRDGSWWRVGDEERQRAEVSDLLDEIEDEDTYGY